MTNLMRTSHTLKLKHEAPRLIEAALTIAARSVGLIEQSLQNRVKPKRRGELCLRDLRSRDATVHTNIELPTRLEGIRSCWRTHRFNNGDHSRASRLVDALIMQWNGFQVLSGANTNQRLRRNRRAKHHSAYPFLLGPWLLPQV